MEQTSSAARCCIKILQFCYIGVTAFLDFTSLNLASLKNVRRQLRLRTLFVMFWVYNFQGRSVQRCKVQGSNVMAPELVQVVQQFNASAIECIFLMNFRRHYLWKFITDCCNAFAKQHSTYSCIDFLCVPFQFDLFQ
jgi:hypothetical protein